MEIKEYITVMKALSDPNRVKALKLLERRELCVCELTELLGLAQPTVSKHLKILEQAGLVAATKKGQWVNYHQPETTGRCAAAMLETLSGWLEDDREMRKLYGRLPFVDRETICAGKG